MQLISLALVGGKKQSDQALNFSDFFFFKVSLHKNISYVPTFHLLSQVLHTLLLLKLLPPKNSSFQDMAIYP